VFRGVCASSGRRAGCASWIGHGPIDASVALALAVHAASLDAGHRFTRRGGACYAQPRGAKTALDGGESLFPARASRHKVRAGAMVMATTASVSVVVRQTARPQLQTLDLALPRAKPTLMRPCEEQLAALNTMRGLTNARPLHSHLPAPPRRRLVMTGTAPARQTIPRPTVLRKPARPLRFSALLASLRRR
jgi:hypothetical protein